MAAAKVAAPVEAPVAVATPPTPSPSEPAVVNGRRSAEGSSAVVEKTGYPKDMLDLDLDLEADLDTVKQAELFAAIRGEYDIPREPGNCATSRRSPTPFSSSTIG